MCHCARGIICVESSDPSWARPGHGPEMEWERNWKFSHNLFVVTARCVQRGVTKASSLDIFRLMLAQTGVFLMETSMNLREILKVPEEGPLPSPRWKNHWRHPFNMVSILDCERASRRQGEGPGPSSGLVRAMWNCEPSLTALVSEWVWKPLINCRC